MTIAQLEKLARIQQALWIKEGLEAAHPGHARTMLFDHEATLHQTNAMLTRSGPFPCKCLSYQMLRKRLLTFVVLRLRRNNGMEVSITHMSENTPLDAHFCQELLGIRDQLWETNVFHSRIRDARSMPVTCVDVAI